MKLVAPFTPHLADESCGAGAGPEGFVYDQPWPEYIPIRRAPTGWKLAIADLRQRSRAA